jgi:hypothetical protein
LIEHREPLGTTMNKLFSSSPALMIAALALSAPACIGLSEASEPAAPALSLMPRVDDYTHLFWAEGFPSMNPSAPWVRVIQTGRYAIAINTETLKIAHFGPLASGVGYVAAACGGNDAWQNLPPAELKASIKVGDRIYHATAGGKWTDFNGPRLVESGRWLQRADITDLVFSAEDGGRLNVESRLEMAAWPDRLAIILAARPGLLPIPAGEACFGRVGGGFGLDGSNHLEIPHSPDIDAEQFTLELWAFVPADFQASQKTFPWLVCKNHHEQAEGNYGIVILNGNPQARINIGGGRDNMFVVDSRSPLRIDQWNHLAISYDGNTFRFYLNGDSAGQCVIGRKRVAGKEGLAFGRRQDNCGDGYHFRGAVDEIRFYHRALSPDEIRSRFQSPEVKSPALKAEREWRFREDGVASLERPGERFEDAEMELGLKTPRGDLAMPLIVPQGVTWARNEWLELAISFDPVSLNLEPDRSPVVVKASEIPGGAPRPVDYDDARGWHRVNLDGIEPLVPTGGVEKQNDAVERVRIVLSNPTDSEQTARLLFEKGPSGFRQRIGSAITGMSAILRDADGNPTGVPVQLSKNWHGRPEGGVYSGLWFHGFSQVRLAPRANVELELTLAYGHWGGVAAASHSQLCLIGWGSNQLWNESAMGSWGESICYEPDQVQGQCSILDVRPLMVRSMAADQSWSWTHNVGGGDFFRFFDASGQRVPHASMHTAYERYGPCLTEVTNSGRIGSQMTHRETVSLVRSDDIMRGTYRMRLDVREAVKFSRFVLFQIGADTYGYTGERKMAVGNETGLLREWATQWGGNVNRHAPIECAGRVPWISLHEAVSRAQQEARARGEAGAPGAWANRGIVIRSWQARLGGKPASPWVVEHGVNARGTDTSTLDIVPPPEVKRLEPGDFVETTIEHLIIPQFAADYYGPNETLREALKKNENTWRMVYREACGNDRRVEMKAGSLSCLYPSVAIAAANDEASFSLTGGLGYVPVTFSGLTSPRGYELQVDGRPLNQSVHGNDYWQTDYDEAGNRWSRTYNIPAGDDKPHDIRLSKKP